jgi:hypothetical protein
MNRTFTLARRLFFWAGVYGLIVIFPQYFLEERIGQDFPPAITHPEHFYGFLGTALAWQLAFFVIAKDVVRYRLLMIPGALEKIFFAVAVFSLYLQGRVAVVTVGFAALDLLLACLFLWAFFSITKLAK